jgi:hypothetical protein
VIKKLVFEQKNKKKNGAGEIMTCILRFIINHYSTAAEASWLWSPWQPQRYQLNVWFNTFDKSITVEQTHIFTAVPLLYGCDMFY